MLSSRSTKKSTLVYVILVSALSVISLLPFMFASRDGLAWFLPFFGPPFAFVSLARALTSLKIENDAVRYLTVVPYYAALFWPLRQWLAAPSGSRAARLWASSYILIIPLHFFCMWGAVVLWRA